jgi:hypothetical protein
MDDDVLRFDDYRKRRGRGDDDSDGGNDDENVVRCARCGQRIPAISLQCPQCRVHFRGEAQDFIHPDEQRRPTAGGRFWMMIVAGLLIAALVAGALANW